jgi:hypothetical protein
LIIWMILKKNCSRTIKKKKILEILKKLLENFLKDT